MRERTTSFRSPVLYHFLSFDHFLFLSFFFCLRSNHPSYPLSVGDRYPMESPEVVFIPPSPEHPHIYSNGHICLSILYDEWRFFSSSSSFFNSMVFLSPALTIKNVCLSILSMMSSATEKVRPEDNDRYVRTTRHGPKQTSWWFHDDTC